ncbi:MAG: putative dsRNA-binding protein [Methanomicrobiales archaeon]|nr:putative dsRNA-binding protein [Methanomicrobiales archaeon]
MTMEWDRKRRVLQLLTHIGVPDPKDEIIEMCDRALTHRSYAGWDRSYERLEFLGDRVLNLVVARFFYENPQILTEGRMSRRMEFTKNRHLGAIIPTLAIGFEDPDLILRGRGTPLTTRIIAGAFEALVGALYLRCGMMMTYSLLEKLLGPELEHFDPDTNFKGILQEHLMKQGKGLPDYQEIDVAGPNNDRTFTYRVIVEGRTGRGTGRSKTEAQQMAAENVLNKLGIAR